MGILNIFKKKEISIPKVEVKFKEEVDPIYQSQIALKQTLKAKQADEEKTKKLSTKLTEDERKFINEFIKKAKPYAKGKKIIYNFRSGNINFEVNDMQIGRISLNDKNRTMQILTKDDVKWITPITYDDAIMNIEKWIEYMKWLLSDN